MHLKIKPIYLMFQLDIIFFLSKEIFSLNQVYVFSVGRFFPVSFMNICLFYLLISYVSSGKQFCEKHDARSKDNKASLIFFGFGV